MDAPDDIANAASQVVSAVACTILISMQTSARGQLTRNAKASDPEPFDGSQENTEQFVRSICIAVTMQLNAFSDKRMKILYTLSFMRGRMAKSGQPMRLVQSWTTCPPFHPSRTFGINQKDLQ